jgi:peptidoglycan hydrolase CwlO-like protein
MASPGHKANILNKRYTEIGVAVGKGTYKDESIWMAVQHFGLPKSACPSIDETLHNLINNDQKKVKTIENDLSNKRSEIDNGVSSSTGETGSISEKIEYYNNLVTEYNNLFKDIKEKINKYNEQVKSFNECIAEVN